MAEVLRPGSPAYDAVRKPAMARFWDVRPEVIVRCHSAADVAEALALARRSGLEVAVRGGGHCFAGGSSTRGVLVDVRPMNAITVGDGTVSVGAGATLGELYDALEARGRTVAAGCGPSVGIAGLTLGGGLGILGRRHGLTSDQLLAAEVVLGDGRAVWCDEDRHADLVWALRGAGGARFGVVCTLVLRTLPAPDATAFDLRWPHGAAAAVIDAWQGWAPDAPDEIAPSLLVTAGPEPDEPVAVKVFGAALASEPDARRTLGDLVARAGVEPTSATFVQLPYRQVKRHLAESDGEEEPGHVFAKSEFFRSPLTAEAIAALVAHIGGGRVPGQARGLDFMPWGGAYNRVPSGATAFPHRAERFLLKHEVVAAAGGAPAAREWLARSWELAHASGGAYANFPDPDLDPWDPAYHGANLDRLRGVKARYDPDGVFC